VAVTVSITSSVRAAVPRALLTRAAAAAFAHSKARSVQLSVSLVGDAAMRALNARVLGHDYTTDVLSWNLGPSGEVALAGELVICRPFAVRMAKQHGVPVNEELARYMIHGCLHIIGYDDHDDADRAKMWEVQEELVRRALQTRGA
jgi:probable rRNA maturation factor